MAVAQCAMHMNTLYIVYQPIVPIKQEIMASLISTAWTEQQTPTFEEITISRGQSYFDLKQFVHPLDIERRWGQRER